MDKTRTGPLTLGCCPYPYAHGGSDTGNLHALVSDARRSPTTPPMLRTPPRTPTHCQGEFNHRRLSFRPDTEDADTEDLTETACQENAVPGCAATDNDNVAIMRMLSRHHVPTGQAKAADAHANPLPGLGETGTG